LYTADPFLFSGNLAICGAFVPESEFVMTLLSEDFIKGLAAKKTKVINAPPEVIDAPCCGTREYSCSCTKCPKKPREEEIWKKYRPINK